MTPTPKSALPQWKGHPVPWVARWTGEVDNTPGKVRAIPAGIEVYYENGLEVREGCGVLWKREGMNRRGEPEFGQINTWRQRACMTRRRCQVCGNVIKDRVIHWLMSRAQLSARSTTNSPPTCQSCIPLAMELCPHLRSHDAIICKVLDYETFGVFAEVIYLDEKGQVKSAKGVSVPYDDERINYRSVIAKQVIVKFNKFVIEEVKA